MANARFTIFVLSALALGGCSSSSGRYVAVPGVPTAWDGDGAREVAPPRKKMAKRAKPAAMARSRTNRSLAALNGARGEAVPPSEALPPADVFAAEEAANREAEARLARKLTICRGCLPPSGDETIGGIARR
jgi:hypothetical protein